MADVFRQKSFEHLLKLFDELLNISQTARTDFNSIYRVLDQMNRILIPFINEKDVDKLTIYSVLAINEWSKIKKGMKNTKFVTITNAWEIELRNLAKKHLKTDDITPGGI